MKILITGGSGFIGSHLVKRLLEIGHDIEILTRFTDKNLKTLKSKKLTITEGDITDAQLQKKIVIEKDICIYLAFNYGGENGSSMLISDTLPAIQIADNCAINGVKHFIYTSSTAVNDFVYKSEHAKIEGSIHNVDKNTKHNPASYYGATKSAIENYLNAIANLTNMNVTIVRPGYTFGKHLFSNSTVHSNKPFLSMFKNAIDGDEINVIKNDGVQFIAVEDLIEIYLSVINKKCSHKMYLGVSNQHIKWENIALKIIEICNSKSKLKINDRGWNDPILFDASDIKNDFGLEFSPWNKLVEHLHFLLGKVQKN